MKKLTFLLFILTLISSYSTAQVISEKENKDPKKTEYYTNPDNNSGTGENYYLIGRLPVLRPMPKYKCNREGRVIVEIKVNRDGKVITAKPGAKGSTTAASCLLNEAKIAALKTTWEPAPNAPELQEGKLIYNFSLY